MSDKMKVEYGYPSTVTTNESVGTNHHSDFGGNSTNGKNSMEGDDSSLEPTDELATGEVLHCLFPGCMKGITMKSFRFLSKIS